MKRRDFFKAISATGASGAAAWLLGNYGSPDPNNVEVAASSGCAVTLPPTYNMDNIQIRVRLEDGTWHELKGLGEPLALPVIMAREMEITAK